MYILTLPYGKMNLDANNNGSSTCRSDECIEGSRYNIDEVSFLYVEW